MRVHIVFDRDDSGEIDMTVQFPESQARHPSDVIVLWLDGGKIHYAVKGRKWGQPSDDLLFEIAERLEARGLIQ